jgi:hypothetical protein
MLPVLFLCPPILAAGWRGMLARDGLEVEPAADGCSGVLRLRGRAHAIRLAEEEDGRWSCARSDFPRGLERVVQPAFVASGAEIQPPEAVPWIDPILRWEGPFSPEAATPPGATAQLTARPPSGGGSAPERFLAGDVTRGKHRVSLDAGPALSPESGEPALYIRLRPRFAIRFDDELRRLLLDIVAHLEQAGAARRPTDRDHYLEAPK